LLSSRRCDRREDAKELSGSNCVSGARLLSGLFVFFVFFTFLRADRRCVQRDSEWLLDRGPRAA
jgi:hypothetical protein